MGYPEECIGKLYQWHEDPETIPIRYIIPLENGATLEYLNESGKWVLRGPYESNTRWRLPVRQWVEVPYEDP